MPIIEDPIRPPAQTARILGTGLEVWEIVRTYLEVGRDWSRLLASFHWLNESDLVDAIEYAQQHVADIEARIRENYNCLPEALQPDPPLHWDGCASISTKTSPMS